VRIRSLAGKRVVFTGTLSIPRAAARKLARKAGATEEARVSHLTDEVEVGGQSPHWKAEAKGQKLLDVDHEAERGHTIALVRESRFLALVQG
jgi:NAD-dependent DNA ligase